jgi:Mg2+ and Co2+ transporter CorA
VDPSITHGFPLWSGYGNFHPPPSVDTQLDEISFPPYDGSVVQEFIFWTLNQARSKANVIPPSPDLLPLAFFTMVCAQWLIMCEYVNTRLGQIEWEIELGLSHLYAQDFDHTLKTLLTWRRRMPIYNVFVERSISRISERYKSADNTVPFNSWQDILTNLREILHRLEILHCRADKIMAVSMAVTAREESKKATQESRAITRVSYLAFVFVPLSFWTSFFSMSGEFPLTTYWIYAAVALPISACAFCALVFAGKIGRWWRRRGWRGETDLGKEKGKSKWNSGV